MHIKRSLFAAITILVSSVGCQMPGMAAQPVKQLASQSNRVLTTAVPPMQAVAPTLTAVQPTRTSKPAEEGSEQRAVPATPTAAPTAVEAWETLLVTSPPSSPVLTGVAVSDDAGGPPSSPRIISFTASPESVNVGDTVTLSWNAAGSNARIGACLSADDGHLVHPCSPSEYMPVPLVGTRTMTIPMDARYSADFILSVGGNYGGEAVVYSHQSVGVICPTTWFFEGDLDPLVPSHLCPKENVVTSQAAYESFENGFMMWVASQNLIGAFWDPMPEDRWWGSSVIGKDQWVSSMPDSDPGIVPPDGLYQPIRGFGLVWRSWTASGEVSVRDILGWAIAPEFSFEVVYQCSVPRWHEEYCNYQDPYGRIITLDLWFGGWSMIKQ
jgi:hypothetical protein